LALAITGALREELSLRGVDMPMDRMMDAETEKLWAAIEEIEARL